MYNNEFVIGPVPFGKHLIAAAAGLCTTKVRTVSSLPVSLRLLSNLDIHRKIGSKNNTFKGSLSICIDLKYINKLGALDPMGQLALLNSV